MLRVRLSDSARSRWASTFHLSICSLAKLRINDYQWLSSNIYWKSCNKSEPSVWSGGKMPCLFLFLPFFIEYLPRHEIFPKPGLATSGLRLEPSLLVLLTQLRLKKQQKLATSLVTKRLQMIENWPQAIPIFHKIFQNIPNANYIKL